MSLKKYILESKVETIYSDRFDQECITPNTEKIKKIVVPDFEMLGKLTALRFIEWCQLNDGGVVSLATGNTPKTFIKSIHYFLSNWNTSETQKELALWGLNCKTKPDLSKFTLVQMDEYFPINSNDSKSFFYYINSNYVDKLGFLPQNCLLMNLSDFCQKNGLFLNKIFPDGNINIKTQAAEQIKALNLIKGFALDFECKIKELGGIGFFLGGIGPDGHVAFNFKESEHTSITRMLPINYESAAAASAGFGGIEFIRNKAVLTIGLKTITQNPTTTAIIIADGVGKANVVRDAIESEPSTNSPATSLQNLTGSRFYLTETAASNLKTYKYSSFKKTPQNINSWGQQVLVELAIKKNKTITQLNHIDVAHDVLGNLLLEQNIKLDKFIKFSHDELVSRVNNGLSNFSGKTFLHTSPHPDDVLLGYYPFINQHSFDQQSKHFFATMTSGSNTVQNKYITTLLNNFEKNLSSILPLNEDPNTDVTNYISALVQNNNELKIKAQSSRLLRNFTKFMEINSNDKKVAHLLQDKITAVKESIERGENDNFIIALKSSIREWEEDLVWGHLGFGHENIFHLNLGFYTNKDKNIDYNRDVKPVLNLIKKVNPDIITIALDPKIGGHPTHYKIRQIITQALQNYDGKNITIWGYNNVWVKFNPTQSNLYLTATANDFIVLNSLFNTCYGSQVSAAVPSPELDGPFSELMQKITVDQYNNVRTAIGENFFDKSKNRQIAATRGLLFIKSMTVDELVKIYDR